MQQMYFSHPQERVESVELLPESTTKNKLPLPNEKYGSMTAVLPVPAESKHLGFYTKTVNPTDTLSYSRTVKVFQVFHPGGLCKLSSMSQIMIQCVIRNHKNGPSHP